MRGSAIADYADCYRQASDAQRVVDHYAEDLLSTRYAQIPSFRLRQRHGGDEARLIFEHDARLLLATAPLCLAAPCLRLRHCCGAFSGDNDGIPHDHIYD